MENPGVLLKPNPSIISQLDGDGPWQGWQWIIRLWPADGPQLEGIQVEGPEDIAYTAGPNRGQLITEIIDNVCQWHDPFHYDWTTLGFVASPVPIDE